MFRLSTVDVSTANSPFKREGSTVYAGGDIAADAIYVPTTGRKGGYFRHALDFTLQLLFTQMTPFYVARQGECGP